MSEWLGHHAEWLGTARFQGLLYDIGAYPGAVKSRNKNAKVIGDIYRMAQPHQVLATLDDYEECAPNHPRPHEYVRTIETIELTEGSQTQAWIYLYNRPVDGLKTIVNGDYLAFIR